MKRYAFEDFNAAGREQLRSALALAAMRREHTEKCARLREDPGATCVCRPPRADEPLRPTPSELELSIRSQR